MRTVFIVATLLIALTGCATNYQSPRVTENVWKNWASIGLRSEKISDREYRIVASGAAASKETDVIEAWEEFASKIAGGRPYTKEHQTESYSYRDTLAPGAFQGRRVAGKIILAQ